MSDGFSRQTHVGKTFLMEIHNALDTEYSNVCLYQTNLTNKHFLFTTLINILPYTVLRDTS